MSHQMVEQRVCDYRAPLVEMVGAIEFSAFGETEIISRFERDVVGSIPTERTTDQCHCS